MEGPDASLNWEWQDELLASLDADSPLDTAHTLWEDINQSEGMLETTPASKFSKGDQESLWDDLKDKQGYSNELIYEDSPHIKRRRMLHFEGEEDDGVFLDSSLEPSQFSSLENLTEIYDIHQNRDTQMLEPTSSTSMWFNNDDDDIASVERCNNGDWLSGSLIERECESQQCLGGENQQLSRIIESTARKTDEGKSTQTTINTVSHLKRNLSGHNMSPSKMVTPVAYPFEVVKPSGMQGDVTLNDINKRIMMVHDRPRGHNVNGSSTEACGNGGFTSNSLTKSVVALTKIHTEGNGTITIMRTKN